MIQKGTVGVKVLGGTSQRPAAGASLGEGAFQGDRMEGTEAASSCTSPVAGGHQTWKTSNKRPVPGS